MLPLMPQRRPPLPAGAAAARPQLTPPLSVRLTRLSGAERPLRRIAPPPRPPLPLRRAPPLRGQAPAPNPPSNPPSSATPRPSLRADASMSAVSGAEDRRAAGAQVAGPRGLGLQASSPSPSPRSLPVSLSSTPAPQKLIKQHTRVLKHVPLHLAPRTACPHARRHGCRSKKHA